MASHGLPPPAVSVVWTNALPKGLALVPALAKDAPALGRAAAMGIAAAAKSPMAAYNSKGAAFIAAAGIAAAYNARCTAHAESAVLAPNTSWSLSEDLIQLRPVYTLFYPVHLFKLLAKNLGLQFLIRFNKYMVETLEHEKQALIAEQNGEEPPEPPPLPSLSPVWDRGMYNFCRELAVGTTRRLYEHVAVWRLTAPKAQALLRDSKAWIRDVLSKRHAGESWARRFVKYQFATLHATALFFAADCTVAITYHTYRTYRRRDRGPKAKAVIVAKGAGLQVARCFVTMVLVSFGAAAGSLAKPGLGTMVGHMGTEALVSMGVAMVIETLLD